MSRETDFRTAMLADAPLSLILTGGVFTYASLGRDGLTRDAVATAFDETGFLKPMAIVKQRMKTPDGGAVDTLEQVASTVQIVEIWLYEDEGYTAVDAAMGRLFTLFYGQRLADTWELDFIGGLDRQTEEGQLKGASLLRMDWQVNSLM